VIRRAERSSKGSESTGPERAYYNYKSDTLRREPRSDEYVVTEAFIYDTHKTEVTAAITFVASGPEMDRMARDEAIRRRDGP